MKIACPAPLASCLSSGSLGKKIQTLGICLVALLQFAVACPCQATDILWTNASGGNWNIAANWTPNQVPGALDNAFITNNGTYTVTLNVAATNASLTLGGASGTQTLQLSSGAATLALNGASVVRLNGVLIVNLGTLTNLNSTVGLDVNGTLNWLSGTISGGLVTIKPGGTLSLPTGSSKTLTACTLINAGTFAWSNSITVNSSATISNAVNGTATLTGVGAGYGGGGLVVNDGQLSISVGAGNSAQFGSVSGATFNNNGTVDIQNGTLKLCGGTTSGTGSFNIESGAGLNCYLGTHNLLPGSTVTGPGTFTNSGATVNLKGSFSVTGTLHFNGGTANFLGNYSISNNAINLPNGTANFMPGGTIAPGILNLTGGTLGASNMVTVTSLMNWSGGTIQGPNTAIHAKGGLTISQGTSKNLTDCVLINENTLTWSDGVLFSPGATISNASIGTMFLSGNANSGSGAGVVINDGQVFGTTGPNTWTLSSAFINNGTVSVQSGTLVLSGGGTVSSNGTFSIDSGATLNFGGRTNELMPGSTVTGPGTFTVSSGTVNLNGTFSVTGTNNFSGGTANFLGNYTISGNTVNITYGTANFMPGGMISPAVLNIITGTGTLGARNNNISVSGLMTWNSGNINGSNTTIHALGGVTISPAYYKYLTDCVLVNDSALTWGDSVILNSGATISNAATRTMTLVGNASLGSGGVGAVINDGQIIGAIGTNNVWTLNPAFVNNGTVSVQSGTLQLSGGGTTTATGSFSIGSGATLSFGGRTNELLQGSSVTGPGNFSVSGATVNLKGAFSVTGTLNFTGGTANFLGNYTINGNTVNLSGFANFMPGGTIAPGVLNISGGALGVSNSISVSGPMTWSAGTIQGSNTTINALGGLTIANGSFKTLADCRLINLGAGTWSGSQFIMSGAGVFSNAPSGTINIAAAVSSGGGVIANAGQFNVAPGVGNIFSLNSFFTNYGTIQVQSGTLMVPGGSLSAYSQAAGLTLLSGGNINNSVPLRIQGGMLTGTGVVTGSVTNSGVISPGSSAGKLTIGGNCTQTASGALNIELGGSIQGTDLDLLVVTNTATISGLLNVSFINGFLPAPGSSYEVMKFSSRTGVFTTVNGLQAANGIVLEPRYSATNVTLVTVPPAPAATSYTWTTLAGRSSIGSADGVGGLAQFSFPIGVAVDTNGNVYVAEPGNDTIRRISPAGVVTTIAGFAGSPGSADGTNSAARFNFKSDVGIAADFLGRLYVADSDNYAVRRLTPVGTNWVVDTIAGQAGSSGTNNGLGTNALFCRPTGIVVGQGGDLFVCDSNTIRRIVPIGNIWQVSTVAGQPGTSGTNDGVGGSARFNQPRGIAVDGATNVFVADTENATIRKLTLAGADWIVSTIAGSATNAGSLDGTNGVAQFDLPTGIALDTNGYLYVSDNATHTIRRVTHVPGSTNWAVTTLAGQAGNSGSVDGVGTNALFNSPSGVVVDKVGNVFVADSLNNTVRKLTPAAAVRTIAGLAPGGGADGVGTSARFNSPQAVAVDQAGNVYVADSQDHTIRQISSAGEVTTLAGLAGMSGTNDGVANTARFSFPAGVAVDADGNVYVADTGNYKIRQVTQAGVVSTIAGSAAGTNDGSGTDAKFQNLIGLTLAASGELFVGDGDRIRKITPAGTNWNVTTVAHLSNSLASIAVDNASNLYLLTAASDPSLPLIQILTPSGGLSTLSQNYLVGSGGLALDFAGSLYVSDAFSNSIWKVAPVGTNWVPVLIGGGGRDPGEPGSADGGGSAAQFQTPRGLVVDAAGNVYLADSGNHTIRKGIFTGFTPRNSVVLAPPQTNGVISVTLQPAEAVAAGAKWRFPWEVGWRESGTVASNLAEGNYAVEFRDASGWAAPSNDIVTVTANSSNSLVYSYIEIIGSDPNNIPGSLTVNLGTSPPSAARWGFLGQSFDFPNNFTTNLPPGLYLIGFQPVSGYSTPPSLQVEIFSGQPLNISVRYLLAQSKPDGVSLPVPVPPDSISDLADYPFGFNGQLKSKVGYASGVAVQENVVLTIAHAVFDDQTLSYVGQVLWYPQQELGQVSAPPLEARGAYLLGGYGAQRGYAAQRMFDLTNGIAPDQSTPQSRNLDVAALYFLFPVARGGYGGYLHSDAEPNPWLTGTSPKMLVGYPVDGSLFGDATITNGVMYETGPQPYPLALSTDPIVNQQVYTAPWFLSYPGNSGGPLYAQYNGYYYPAGLYLGTLYNGAVPYASAVRAIDGEVANLINTAAAFGDSGTNGTGGGVIIFNSGSSGSANLAYLRVKLGPAAARAAGAAWKLGSRPWDTNAIDTLAFYTNGVITLQFTNIPGWEAPNATNASLVLGQVMTVVATYGPPLATLSFVPGTGLGISGTPGAKFALDFSTSLSSGVWVPLKTNTLGPGFNQLLDWPPTNGPAAFYRARWVP